ncbi:MAG: hypothetical protein NTZ04_02475 [Chloroflexi bacterium]|nr:hypothetical protein [Chloroflexota bacterium]
MYIFEEILDRLLEDQESNRKSVFHGQFARNRDKSTRAAVQKDGEPLKEKPELYMTFNAVQTLQYLRYSISQSSYKSVFRPVLEERKDKMRQAVNIAGDFAERLLLQHSDNQFFITMHEKIAFGPIDEFISYRHTVGAAIILRLLERRSDIESKILRKLLTSDIQNRDGGWPIADKKHTTSDILCSAHAAYLFHLALKSGDYDDLRAQLENRISSTLAFLTLQVEQKSGLWVYEHESGALPFTARTYPEVYKLLIDCNSPLVHQIPKRLLEHCRANDRPEYTMANRKKTGIRNMQQFEVRMAYAFKTASRSMPDEFLEAFAETRYNALSRYSKSEYYETYDLCCLLMMLIDSFNLSHKELVKDGVFVFEPIIEELPFVGKPYRVSKKIYERLKERKWLSF